MNPVKTPRYGHLEFTAAEPFANALINSASLRRWIIGQTKFQTMADARLLHEEMFAARGRGTATWWRSHFSMRCSCEGCRGGKETDLLAIFESQGQFRFALHFEVKNLKDRFDPKKDQPRLYGIRAKCWAKTDGGKPLSVLTHHDAETILLCNESNLRKFAPHIPSFDRVVTFEDAAKQYISQHLPELDS